MVELKLQGSGGYIIADLTEEHLEENTNEQVADNLILVERGQYTCQQCSSIIGEYRVFKKQDESSDIGNARPSQ